MATAMNQNAKGQGGGNAARGGSISGGASSAQAPRSWGLQDFRAEGAKRGLGFTLIELLVVIAIIGILAAMIIPISGAVARYKIRSRTRAEMQQIVSAIENYKTKRGFYPPDCPTAPVTNLLYYELSGTAQTNNTYTTLDGAASIDSTTLGSAFGASGLINCTRQGAGDEGITAQRFLTEVKPSQIGDLNGPRLLVASVGWPQNQPGAPISGTTLNPWRYTSSAATNNPGGFDLWIDVLVSGKTNRICNWSTKVLTP